MRAALFGFGLPLQLISRSGNGYCLIKDNPKCVTRRYWLPPPLCMTSKRHQLTGASAVSIGAAIASGSAGPWDQGWAFVLLKRLWTWPFGIFFYKIDYLHNLFPNIRRCVANTADKCSFVAVL